MLAELDTFLANWDKDSNRLKALFLSLYAMLQKLDGVRLEYKGRAGISYSLRALYPAKKERPLFVLIDVIDDLPEARWLSICFYADLITDSEARGDVVPVGLLGEDARCFDIDAPEDNESFLLERLREAYNNISK